MKHPITYRRCPACAKRVATHRLGPHRRSDACTGRPIPTPQRCACGRGWPCTRCEVLLLIALGCSIEHVATRLDLSVARVHREVEAFHRTHG